MRTPRIMLTSQLNWYNLLPILAAFLVIGLFLFFYSTYILCANSWAQCETPKIESLLTAMRDLPPQVQLEKVPREDILKTVAYPGHLTWITFMGLFVVVCLIALFIGGRTINNAIEDGTRVKVCAVCLTFLFAASFATLIHYGYLLSRGRGEPHPELWQQIVRVTVAVDLKNAEAFFSLFQNIAAGMVFFLALAASATLLCPADNETPEKRREYLDRQMKNLTLLLYVSTSLLIISTLQLSALMHWALSYLQPPPSLDPAKDALFIYKGIDNLTSSIVTSTGAYYTLILVAVFVPAALVLNQRGAKSPASRRAAEKAEKRKPENQEKASETGHGVLALPLSEHLLRLAAILGPLLAGPLGDLLARL